jgi:alkylhydroperoxidase/carboxymuconolactone decarboxylase family protein YurZ
MSGLPARWKCPARLGAPGALAHAFHAPREAANNLRGASPFGHLLRIPNRRIPLNPGGIQSGGRGGFTPASTLLWSVAMDKEPSGVSQAFKTFFKETPEHARAWMAAVEGLGSASALDKKTEHLAYLAVLAALRLESGIPFHVQLAKKAGASRAEVMSVVLVGLPAVGNGVIQSLPATLAAYDAA